MGTAKRIDYIDLAKGICILLVVWMHVVPELGKGNPLMVNLRMPLYYFLSGMFFKTYGNFRNFIVKKTDKLLIPFIAWYLISYGIYYARVLAIGHPEHVFNITDLFLDSEFYNGSIWFLLSLLWCNIIYFAINSVSSKEIVRLSFVIIIALSGWIYSYSDIGNFLYIGTSLTSLPFFYMGKQMVKYGVVSQNKRIKEDLIVGFICLLVAIMAITIPTDSPRMIFYLNLMEAGNPIFLYLSGLSLILFVLIICKYINRLPYVSYLGRFSIIVLVTHKLLQNIFTRFIEHTTGIEVDNLRGHIILFCVIIALMGVIIPICRRFLPYVCAQKSLLEDKILKKPEPRLLETNRS